MFTVLYPAKHMWRVSSNGMKEIGDAEAFCNGILRSDAQYSPILSSSESLD